MLARTDDYSGKCSSECSIRMTQRICDEYRMSKREKRKRKRRRRRRRRRKEVEDDIDLSFDIVNNVAQEGSRGREGEEPPRARQISFSRGSIPVASCPARRRNVPEPRSAAPLFRRLRLHFITTARWRRLTRAGVLLDVAEKEHPSAPTCRGRRRDVEVFQGGRRQVFEPLHSEGSSTDRFRIRFRRPSV